VTRGKGPEVFFSTVATPVVFVLLALGFHFFLRGHNAPGGGFIAGLIVAVAALLGRMARDLRLLRLRSDRLVPIGLLVALATGAAPMLFGRPFLTSAHGQLHGSGGGSLEWASATLFDLGVFLVVIGTTITIIDLLAEPGGLARLREPGSGGADADGEDAGHRSGPPSDEGGRR
jgi:multicomponent Na+:H+ antiporter subunit B